MAAHRLAWLPAVTRCGFRERHGVACLSYFMAIPHSFIQDLLARADIVDVVGKYVQIKKAGINYKGLCPFHGEKTPSFTVSPQRQTYHCFGCGAHGNAIGFLMEHNGMGFVEAVKDLAQQFGLQVPEEDISPAERQRQERQRQQQATLTGVLEKAAHFYQQQLKTGATAIDYLKRRGLSGKIAAHFGLGYAPAGWHGLAAAVPDYADPMLVEAGLVIVHEGAQGEEERRYDRFRDRVMFPIRNVKGEVIGFGGRVMGAGEPKYLNSPETPVFVKGRELYGLFEARTEIRKHGYLLVTEGYMDVVALVQNGFGNAVATLGTACTADHVQKIFKFTDSVVFSFDGDAAGRKAARRALEAAMGHVSDTRSIKFLFLPTEHDPDSYIRAFGHDGFARYVSEALPLSRFLLEASREGCDLSTAEGRARMLAQARPLWEQVPECGLKRQLLGEIAAQGAVTPQELVDQLWAAPAVAPTVRSPGMAVEPDWGEIPPPMDDVGGPQGFSAESAWQPPRQQRFEKSWDKNRSAWRGKGRWRDRSSEGEVLLPRKAPPAPAEQCVRMLLLHSDWWETLPEADRETLCSQPHWPGEVFRWLERQVVEHGPSPWAVLREAAGNTAWFENAVEVVEGGVAGIEPERADLDNRLGLIRDAAKRAENAKLLAMFRRS